MKVKKWGSRAYFFFFATDLFLESPNTLLVGVIREAEEGDFMVMLGLGILDLVVIFGAVV